jgi:hypothetical protein
MSLIQTPIPDSVPARYLSLPGARRMDITWSGAEFAAGELITGRAWCHAAM